MLGRTRLTPLLVVVAFLVHASPALAQWAPGGVKLNGPGEYGAGGHICVDGKGGAFVAWTDFTDLAGYRWRLQHMDADGRIHPGWPVGGLLVNGIPNANHESSITADGVGGVLLSWKDTRVFGVDRIYGTRYAADGSRDPNWAANGNLVFSGPYCDSGFLYPDGAGGMLVGIAAYNNYPYFTGGSIYLQHLTTAGQIAPGWPARGKLVALNSGNEGVTYSAPDGSGGYIIAWPNTDQQSNGVQRVTADGEIYFGWDSTGRTLSVGQWSILQGGVVSTPGGFILVRSQFGGNSSLDLNFSSLGLGFDFSPLPGWAAGVKVFESAPGDQLALKVISDGQGGAFAAWDDYRNYGVSASDRYVQHITATGDPAAGWPINGAPAVAAPGFDTAGDLVPDGSGGVYVASELQSATQYTTRISHLDAAGQLVFGWPPEGEPIIVIPTTEYPNLCSDERGGAIASLDDGSNIYAQHISPDAPVAATLALVSAEASPDHVSLDWFAPSSAVSQAQLERADASRVWQSLATLTADGSGHLRYDDRAVTPGARYGYRLRYLSAGAERLTAETWVEVPAALRFALEGARPNPAPRGQLAVAFSLAQAAPASLELYDLSGRRVLERGVGSLGAGEHVLSLADAGTAAPGLYWLRLTQGAEHATSRVVIAQ